MSISHPDHYARLETSRGLVLTMYANTNACMGIDSEALSTVFHFSVADLRQVRDMIDDALVHLTKKRAA